MCGKEGAKLDYEVASVVTAYCNPGLRKPALRCLASNDSFHSLFKRLGSSVLSTTAGCWMQQALNHVAVPSSPTQILYIEICTRWYPLSPGDPQIHPFV